MPCPSTKQELQRFMGVIAYLTKFIPNMEEVSAPLHQPLEKNVQCHWNAKHQHSFETPKTVITRTSVLTRLEGCSLKPCPAEYFFEYFLDLMTVFQITPSWPTTCTTYICTTLYHFRKILDILFSTFYMPGCLVNTPTKMKLRKGEF